MSCDQGNMLWTQKTQNCIQLQTHIMHIYAYIGNHAWKLLQTSVLHKVSWTNSKQVCSVCGYLWFMVWTSSPASEREGHSHSPLQHDVVLEPLQHCVYLWYTPQPTHTIQPTPTVHHTGQSHVIKHRHNWHTYTVQQTHSTVHRKP